MRWRRYEGDSTKAHIMADHAEIRRDIILRGHGGDRPIRKGKGRSPVRALRRAIPLPPNGTCPWSWIRSGGFAFGAARALMSRYANVDPRTRVLRAAPEANEDLRMLDRLTA